jgi:hypothetical protein
MMKKTLLGLMMMIKKLTLHYVQNTKILIRRDNRYFIAMVEEQTDSYYLIMVSV